MSGIEYPQPVREEVSNFLRLVLDNEDELLDPFISIFTAALCGNTPMLAAYQRALRWEEDRDEVRTLCAKHKDAPSGRWWPEIVAGCLRLDAARTGHLPRGKDFEVIVQRILAVSEETAEQLVAFSGCHDGATVFHRLWLDIAARGPGLDDALKEAGLRRERTLPDPARCTRLLNT